MKQGILTFLFFILLWHIPSIIREYNRVPLAKIESENRINILHTILNETRKDSEELHRSN